MKMHRTVPVRYFITFIILLLYFISSIFFNCTSIIKIAVYGHFIHHAPPIVESTIVICIAIMSKRSISHANFRSLSSISIAFFLRKEDFFLSRREKGREKKEIFDNLLRAGLIRG